MSKKISITSLIISLITVAMGLSMYYKPFISFKLLAITTAIALIVSLASLIISIIQKEKLPIILSVISLVLIALPILLMLAIGASGPF